MTPDLYPDQVEFVDEIARRMRTSKSILAQAPTGFGKTRVACNMMNRVRLKGKRAGFVVPRGVLLDQTAQSLNDFGVPYGYFAAGYAPNPFEKIQLISGPTLARRLDKAPKLDVVFFDETRFGGADLDRCISHYRAAGSWVVGLDATPIKMNGKPMGDWYDDMVLGPEISWLMENDRLSKYRMFAPDTPDLSSLRVGKGDYVQKDIDSFMMSDEFGKVLIGNGAAHYKKNAMGKLNVSFCTSVANAEMAAQSFNDAGIPSACVHGKMDKAELKRIVMAFARRDILNLTCALLLEFGWDLSQASGMDVTVESMNDFCPTKSLPRIMQRWGRGLRYKPYPALIHDHVGNTLLHGLPDDKRDWSLEGRQKRKRDGSEQTQPVRQCPNCFFVHRPTPDCPACGFTYPIQNRTIEEIEGELAEITERREKKEARMNQGRAQTLEQLMAMGKSRGNAMHILRARQAKAGR